MFYSYSSRGRGFASSPDVFIARRSPSRQQTVGEQQVDEPGRAHSLQEFLGVCTTYRTYKSVI